MNSLAEVVAKFIQLLSKQNFNDLINTAYNLLYNYYGSCELWNLLGSAHLRLEKFYDGICNYDILIDINPKNAVAYDNKENVIRF